MCRKIIGRLMNSCVFIDSNRVIFEIRDNLNALKSFIPIINRAHITI